MAPRGIILAWNRSVIDHLAVDRPVNHTSIAALVPVLIKHADPDGSNCFPGQMTMARQAGLSRDTVAKALTYLEAAGYIEHVANRARGLRVYQLQMPNDSASGSSDADPDVEPTRNRPLYRPPRPKASQAQNEWTTGGVADPIDPDHCPHHPIDNEGWCTACQTQVTNE